MTLNEKITSDLLNALKAKVKVNDLKVIVGEIQRLPEKNPEDNIVIKILIKLIKYEKENLKNIGATTSEYLRILESYIPEQATEEEVTKWIRDNIDFGDFKNKFMTIKIILGYFGPKTNGGIVKKILTDKF